MRLPTGGMDFTGACVRLRLPMMRLWSGFPGTMRYPYGPRAKALLRLVRLTNWGICFPSWQGRQFWEKSGAMCRRKSTGPCSAS